MSTPEQIEELIQKYGFSLNDLPKPTASEYGYEPKDRVACASNAIKWQCEETGKETLDFDERNAYADFICHQSDVIEILVKCLGFCNKCLDYTNGSMG